MLDQLGDSWGGRSGPPVAAAAQASRRRRRHRLEEWAKPRYESFDEDQLALLYGAVIDELFPLARERQQEVERITAGKEPSIGYALLAVLMAHEEYGERTNIVFTTNFDDLMADSLYLLTMKKPLVVVHESLAPYVRPSRSRPLIVKLHGDARLAPRNTSVETANLDDELQRRIMLLLQSSGLVFCGYGGNDHSIARLIRSAPPDAFPLGVYWVGIEMPTGPVGAALQERTEVFHVPQGDFDALMIDVADALDLNLPGFDRWRSLFETYNQALAKQAKAAEAAEQPQQRKTAERLRTRLDASKLAADALAAAKSDPDRADELYRQAVDIDPNNAHNLGSYAWFLHSARRDLDRTEELYRKAIVIDPSNEANVGNYALFLHEVRRDFERAEEQYRRAIALNPSDAHSHCNFAQLLFLQRRDNEAVEQVDTALAQSNIPTFVRLEGNFCLYAHIPARRQKAMQQLVDLLVAGLRAEDSNLSGILERAEQDGDERLPLLRTLSDVITGQKPLESLDRFDEWRNASRQSLPTRDSVPS